MQQQRGSGKTAVLVERIVKKVIDDKIDIDKLLVVTFTNAAAAEMRERILEKLYEKIEENPEDRNLQKQIILLGKASISTIHSFCLDVIKNYFYEIEVSPNFRLGNNEEIELLKQEVLEELFDELYEEESEEFLKLINTYTSYKSDQDLKDMIIKIFKFIQSAPFPEEWISEQAEKFNRDKELGAESRGLDFAKTEWGQILIEAFKEDVESHISSLGDVKTRLNEDLELKKYEETIQNDINELQPILSKEHTWDGLYELVQRVEFMRWPGSPKIESELKDEAKAVRDKVKKKFDGDVKKIFIYSSEQAKEDIFMMHESLDSIKKLVISFGEKYQEAKEEKNIIDFNDIEHLALNILVKKDEEGRRVASPVAKMYQEKFAEIAIDEYQDSNLVQEYILGAISKGNNIFMVGDVKQSIYKFRQARPELFLEKYDRYLEADNEKSKETGTKIKLFKNFRSRKEVLDITNLIFKSIMSKKLGDIEYTEEEYLNLGSSYPENIDKVDGDTNDNLYKPELHIIDVGDSKEEGDFDEEDLLQTNVQIEAKFVSYKIKEMLESEIQVYDKNIGYRNLEFKDIAILLRTTTGVANAYEKELSNLDITVFTDSGNNYFEEVEVQTIMALLKVIDNPNNDIPLVTVLRSMIGNFLDNELLEIRLGSKNVSYYEAFCGYGRSINSSEEVNEKINNFLELLKEFQDKQEYLKLHELIWYIYEKTGYYSYVSVMDNGEIRTANLKKLFEKAKEYEQASFKGLYNFIQYLDKVSEGAIDFGAAKVIGENENSVRIMSIHKSKGLEFPVVFLCGMGKQFNERDLNENLLLHQDIGFGPKYINYERKIEYPTLAKEAIKIKAKNEILSEEMRLLYVALTRSKEKLIMTGICKKRRRRS
ncbi:MAG: helicase-exonuclease AddAB subunit AddA [Oscillospiraceae bacterium]|nr:helicase-exonuclease AddAB subunit AddA [Oscillospiraceae bacterium]